MIIRRNAFTDKKEAILLDSRNCISDIYLSDSLTLLKKNCRAVVEYENNSNSSFTRDLEVSWI